MPLTKRLSAQFRSRQIASRKASRVLARAAKSRISRVPRIGRPTVGRAVVSRNVHSFRRGSATVRDVCTTTERDGALTFTFDDILGYTEFTGLYDRYMITGVKIRIRLINNPTSSQYLNSGNSGYNTPNTTNWWPLLS